MTASSVHNRHEPLTAIILAGGKGTRLRPYTGNIPKPLVPVGDKPIIEILLGQLRKAGVGKAYIAVNHLAHLIMAVLGDGARFDLELEYSTEDRELSTVGPIKLISSLPEHFIVCNGDILTDLDIRSLYQYHLEHGALLTVATASRAEKVDYGVLSVGENGRVTEFSEKPVVDFTVSMGIYVFSREVLAHVPENTRFGFDDLMAALLTADCPIQTFPFEGYWLDIGRPADYEQAQRDIDRVDGLSS